MAVVLHMATEHIQQRSRAELVPPHKPAPGEGAREPCRASRQRERENIVHGLDLMLDRLEPHDDAMSRSLAGRAGRCGGFRFCTPGDGGAEPERRLSRLPCRLPGFAKPRSLHAIDVSPKPTGWSRNKPRDLDHSAFRLSSAKCSSTTTIVVRTDAGSIMRPASFVGHGPSSFYEKRRTEQAD